MFMNPRALQPAMRRKLARKALPLLLFALCCVALFLALKFAPALTTVAAPRTVVENGSFDVHFCPVEECPLLLRETLANATKIACAFYDLNDKPLEELLAAKRASVLVFDKEYRGFGTPIANARSGLMHNKFCVLDDEIVITGSLNPTAGMYEHDNNLVIVRGARLAENYAAEWRELKDGREAPVPHPRVTHTVFSSDNSSRSFLVENYFCPEDACADHVKTILQAANRSVKFFVFSFTDDTLGDALVARAAAGVDVRGVFDRQQNSKYSEYTGLKLAGLDVRLDGNPKLLHHKVFVVDDRIVVTGSYNPTGNGNTRNDENVLIIHDESIARQYVAEFERVYALGTKE